MTEAGLDIGDFGAGVLPRAGKGMAEGVDSTRTEALLADVGDALDAEGFAV